MDNITVGQLFDVVIRLSEFAGAIGVLYVLLMKGIKKILEPMELRRLKSELIVLITSIEMGVISPEQIMLLHEDFDVYTKMGGNSWVREKVEKLHKEGKI